MLPLGLGAVGGDGGSSERSHSVSLLRWVRADDRRQPDRPELGHGDSVGGERTTVEGADVAGLSLPRRRDLCVTRRDERCSSHPPARNVFVWGTPPLPPRWASRRAGPASYASAPQTGAGPDGVGSRRLPAGGRSDARGAIQGGARASRRGRACRRGRLARGRSPARRPRLRTRCSRGSERRPAWAARARR